jgi:hypothetical protein
VGKKVQELTADLGVVGIVEGKLGGGGSTRYRAGAVRFRGWRRCSGDWSAGRQRKLVRELQYGDVVLMVLLVRKEKRWNFGLTRIRMAAEREIAGAMFWLRVRGKRKKSGPRRGNEMRRCWWRPKLERRSGGDG